MFTFFLSPFFQFSNPTLKKQLKKTIEKLTKHKKLHIKNNTAINRPFKHQMKEKYAVFYENKLKQQIEENGIENATNCKVVIAWGPFKHIHAKWMVEAHAYVQQRPELITSGFVRAGLTMHWGNMALS